MIKPESAIDAYDTFDRRDRTGSAWTLGTGANILVDPRYTGRQVWNRQRTDSELADPANTSLGHKSVQRWNLVNIVGGSDCRVLPCAAD